MVGRPRAEFGLRGVLAEEQGKQRRKLERQYAEWHMKATEMAAANGDAKPAMDMLDRLGAVPVTSRQRTELLKAQISASAYVEKAKALSSITKLESKYK